MTLTLKFDVLLKKTLTFACINLEMVATWQASLSADNSYYIISFQLLGEYNSLLVKRSFWQSNTVGFGRFVAIGSLTIPPFHILWNCNIVGLLYHPFILLKQLISYQVSIILHLVKDHWRGPNTRNACIVYIRLWYGVSILVQTSFLQHISNVTYKQHNVNMYLQQLFFHLASKIL